MVSATATLAPVLFLAEQARPIDPEAGEAPVLSSQIDPRQMPRMCPGLARVRLALYAAARPMEIVKQPTGQQLHEMEQEAQTEASRTAWAHWATHLMTCPACRVRLGYPAEVEIKIESEP